jgi:ABC-type multidrug transport system fused ATPase/permease subunit
LLRKVELEGRISNLERVRLLWRYMEMVPNSALYVIAYIVMTVVASLAEGFGLIMFMPLLQSIVGGETFPAIPIFGSMPLLKELQLQDMRGLLMATALAIMALLVLRGVLSYVASILALNLKLKFQSALTRYVFSRLLNVKVQYINKSNYGSLYTLALGHTERASDIIVYAAQMVLNLALLALLGLLLLFMSWKATLSAVAFGLIAIVAMHRLDALQISFGERYSASHAKFYHKTQETLTSIREIHLLSASERTQQAIASNLRELFHAREISSRILNISSPFINSLGGIFVGGMILAGAFMDAGSVKGWISLVLIYMIVLTRIIGPLSGLLGARLGILQHLSAMDELRRFDADCELNRQESGDRHFTGLSEAIAFNDVSFGYGAENEQSVLSHVDLTVQRGQMVALVGPSGSGKTTLANMLPRFIEPTSGQITIDGIPLREFEVASLRQAIGFVSQNPVLFDCSIKDNLRIASPDATMEDIEAAARLAQAHEFIQERSEGYETIVGQQGAMLSGGQRQRLALARIFLKSPPIILLDEVTSQLDSLTEQALQKSLEYFRERSTIMVIAHRLSTIRSADQIIVLDKGRIVERGNHRELVRMGGVYARLVEMQLSDEEGPATNERDGLLPAS